MPRVSPSAMTFRCRPAPSVAPGLSCREYRSFLLQAGGGGAGPAYGRFPLRRAAGGWRPEHSIGLLYLCHLGCAIREALVMTGPARGQMWVNDIASDGGYQPLLDADGARLGFAGWYRRWLDESGQAVA